MHLCPPVLPVCACRQLFAFLCQEGVLFHAYSSQNGVCGSSPHLSCIMSTAKTRKWKSILQSGIRASFDLIERDALMRKTRDSTGDPVHQSVYEVFRETRAKLQWSISLKLSENRMWLLAFASHHSPHDRSRMVTGRPLHTVLSF